MLQSQIRPQFSKTSLVLESAVFWYIWNTADSMARLNSEKCGRICDCNTYLFLLATRISPASPNFGQAGVRILLAKYTRFSPTSENESYSVQIYCPCSQSSLHWADSISTITVSGASNNTRYCSRAFIVNTCWNIYTLFGMKCNGILCCCSRIPPHSYKVSHWTNTQGQFFIGPESDHWQCLSLTDSLTNSRTD